ncbi:MAG: tRNA pseudouridine(55) synthase TruB [Bacilli bacterium]
MRTLNSGILLVNKEPGMTSRKVGNLVGKKFNVKKVGHLGTLDPFATGLLIIALNEGTKVLPFLEDDDKTYVAVFKLGLLTSTLDPEGEVIKEETIEPFNELKIRETLEHFVGEVTQVPPLTSAIRVDGKRLYEYARKGESVEIPPRTVTIKNLRLISYIHPFIEIEATVSKGTYIRTLGEDIGQKLKTHATTVSLKRTRHGNLDLKDAKVLDDLTIEDLIDPSAALSFFPKYKLDDRGIVDVRNGRQVKVDAKEEIIQIVDDNGVLHALCRKNGTFYQPFKGFNL